MASENHKVIDLARSQLNSAICLFVTDQDHISAITLAGAADTLLARLVTNQDKENFTMHLLKKESDPDMKISELGREINDMFHINALKHMDSGDEDSITMDATDAAIGAILKALANYVTLQGNEEDFVQAFLYWVKQNLDPKIYNVDRDPDWQPSS